MSASVVGNLIDGYGRRMNNVRYPTDTYPAEVRDSVEKVHLTHGVRELEQLCGGDEFLCLTLPYDMPLPAPFVGARPLEIWHQMHRSAVQQVLDSIRTQLLELVLDLAERFPEMNKDEDSISSADRSAVAAVVNVHVSGNQNVVAAGSNFSQHVAQQIQQGDVETLLKSLQTSGVSNDDTGDVEKAIADDGQPRDRKLGPKVVKWLGRMTEKFAEGLVAIPPGVLLEMVKKYYGFD